MRYPASEKLEIIQLVEQSHLPVLRTLEKLGIPRQTFYRWYDRYLTGGLEALEDPVISSKRSATSSSTTTISATTRASAT
jgi:transposase-like protein